MRWWGWLDGALMSAGVPETLGDATADVHWTAFNDATRAEWWAAWSGKVRAHDPIPLELWRAAVAAGIVRRSGPRRRATWIAALVTCVVGLSVISVGSIIPPDPRILLDTLPFSLAVVLLGAWDEWHRQIFAGRCHSVVGMDQQDARTSRIRPIATAASTVQSSVSGADR